MNTNTERLFKNWDRRRPAGIHFVHETFRLCRAAFLAFLVLTLISPTLLTDFAALANPTEGSPNSNLSAVSRSEEALYNKVFEGITKFVNENYPRAKITRAGNKIHFEYKTRPNLNTLTGKSDTIPDFGGVIGDIEFKPGEYSGKVRLPQKYAEYAFYSVILMAPYAQSCNIHVYTRLAYPSDTPQDFTDQFQKLMNSFADGTPPSQLEEAQRKASAETPDPIKDQTLLLPSKSHLLNQQQPPAVPVLERKLSLWKAVKAKETVFVFPVINFGKNRYFPITGEFGKAFKISSQIAVDSHLGLPSDPFSIGCYSGDDRFSKHVSKPTRKSLEDLVEWTGEPIEIYDIWKPYFLTTGLDSALIRQIGFNILNLEKLILKETNFYGKRIVELEPALNRLSYFESLAEGEQDLCARLALYDVLDYEHQQTKLEEAWLAGDAVKSMEAAMSSTKNSPELLVAYDKLYQDCNLPLATAVEDALKKPGPMFVSLDLRRVYGEKGLLKLLEQKGFKVSQVSGLMLTLEPGVVTELPYIQGDYGAVEPPPTR